MHHGGAELHGSRSSFRTPRFPNTSDAASQKASHTCDGLLPVQPSSSACDGGGGGGGGEHVIPEQRRSEPQRTPAAPGKLAVADVTVTFKRFLNCKLDEKCAGMSLIFTLLTSAGDSRRIVSALSPTAVFILVLLFILRSEAVIHCTFASFCHLLVIYFAFPNMPDLPRQDFHNPFDVSHASIWSKSPQKTFGKKCDRPSVCHI